MRNAGLDEAQTGIKIAGRNINNLRYADNTTPIAESKELNRHFSKEDIQMASCCFLTSIQITQEAGQVVWYSHLFQNFPQFIVIHIVKGYGIVNKAEIDVFLELSCFFNDPADVGNLISGSSAFSKFSLNTWKFMFHLLLKPGLENFEHYFTSM